MWRRQGVITGQFNPSCVCDMDAEIKRWKEKKKKKIQAREENVVCAGLEAGVATLESPCKVSSMPDENQTQQTKQQMTSEWSGGEFISDT